MLRADHSSVSSLHAFSTGTETAESPHEIVPRIIPEVHKAA